MKHLKKISKESIKKWATTLVIIFFAMVMIFQKDAPTTTDLQFVWNMDEITSHNAPNENATPSQRDYLFQDEAGNETYQGEIVKWQASEVSPPIPVKDSDSLINPDEAEKIIGTKDTEQLYTWTIQTWSSTILPVVQQALDCTTPWNETVKDKDFVLAYQQRTDVNTICNVEKRVCTNGILWGTFTQNSCKDDMVYTYKTEEIISYNQKVLNEYIQPNTAPNVWAEFDTEGKINTTETPTNTRGTSNSSGITQTGTNQSPLPDKADCRTPRWQVIEHGQFVKAYKAPRGFIDLDCEVEIRACVNGNLKGNFTNAKCIFNNTTYADYLNAGSPRTNTRFMFFDWIKGIFVR